METFNIKKKVLAAMASILILGSCESVLDPMPSGHYTDENLDEYPSKLRGFVERAYVLMNVDTYNNNEYIYLDCATDDGVLTSPTAGMRQFAQGAISPASDPFLTYWSRDYQAIYYCNRFLKDRQGINTQYLLSHVADSLLRHNYHGDAFAVRAWCEYDLLKKFGARDVNGKLSGVPIIDKFFELSQVDASSWTRPSFDDCVKQILADCDSAYKYLPVANRDWFAKDLQVQGACRWQKFDQQSITALRALVYQLWASDAFNPDNDLSRWENAAKYAYQAMEFKLTEDGAHGFDPMAPYDFLDPNNKDALLISRYTSKTATMEASQYPIGFRGSATYAPSQNLVDAFPMANGYPITDPRSGYDENNPYAGRDPRFYATIFYDHAKALRSGSTTDVMYTFEMGGKDKDGLQGTGLTNYFLKKHLFMGWNGSDQSVQAMPRCVTWIGWRDMVLAYAEAANRAYGPNDARLGMSAKEALAYVRNRSTYDGAAGLGTKGDPYLEECASSQSSFDALVRNERRIEFCFEGKRFWDLVRWDIPLSERNVPVYKADITYSEDGNTVTYGKSEIYSISLQSPFLPIPYADIQRASGLVQNQGWENWSRQ